MGDLLLDFVVYVHPLLKLFEWAEGRLLSPFLWSQNGKVWDEKTLTRKLRKGCAAAEVPALSESHWRQICASIIKIHFGADRRCFQPLTQEDEQGKDEGEEEDGEEEEVAALARMSNHTVRTHNRAYANETSLIAANVWDGLIKRGYRASLLWTTFFRYEGDGQGPGPQKRARVVTAEEEGEDQGIRKKIAVSIPRL